MVFIIVIIIIISLYIRSQTNLRVLEKLSGELSTF